MFARMVQVESAARMSMGDYAILRKPAAPRRPSFGMWGLGAAAVIVGIGAFVLAF